MTSLTKRSELGSVSRRVNRVDSALRSRHATSQWHLRARGVDTILIAGAVTNICCESSARDAVELDYKVIMISDALSGQAHGLHEATLATFYRIFGDVRPSKDVIGLLR